VPADMRLAEAAHLRIEEAALTGESVPIEKQTEALHDEQLPLATGKTWHIKGPW